MIDGLNLKPGVWKSIESALYQNPETLETFSKNLFNNEGYYTRIRNWIREFDREGKVKIVDAF